MKINARDLHLEATMESGQVFGFHKNADGSYAGILQGKPVRFWREKGFLYAQGATEAAVRHYFDLDRDLEGVYRILREDPALVKTLVPLKGLRLIRQDSWEALAGFILSSNNNVKRIQLIWRNLTAHFTRLRRGKGEGFPSAFEIASSHEKILRGLGLGYRAPFLHRTAQFLSVNPKFLETIRDAEYSDARERVMAFPGIGPKVADCALLYGFQKYESFPVDVWILRAMRKLYFKNRRVSVERVLSFAQKRWGKDAGYVQQYIFHGSRMKIL